MPWDNLINGLTLLGIPLVVLIPLIIQAFKSWGMSERWTGPVAALLGIAGMAAVQAIAVWPYLEVWVKILVYGLLIGLAANGAYSQFTMWKGKLAKKPDAEILDSYQRPPDNQDTLLAQRGWLIDHLREFVTIDTWNKILGEAETKYPYIDPAPKLTPAQGPAQGPAPTPEDSEL